MAILTVHFYNGTRGYGKRNTRLIFSFNIQTYVIMVALYSQDKFQNAHVAKLYKEIQFSWKKTGPFFADAVRTGIKCRSRFVQVISRNEFLIILITTAQHVRVVYLTKNSFL